MPTAPLDDLRLFRDSTGVADPYLQLFSASFQHLFGEEPNRDAAFNTDTGLWIVRNVSTPGHANAVIQFQQVAECGLSLAIPALNTLELSSGRVTTTVTFGLKRDVISRVIPVISKYTTKSKNARSDLSSLMP